jgi:hypothetical protein
MLITIGMTCSTSTKVMPSFEPANDVKNHFRFRERKTRHDLVEQDRAGSVARHLAIPAACDLEAKSGVTLDFLSLSPTSASVRLLF